MNRLPKSAASWAMAPALVIALLAGAAIPALAVDKTYDSAEVRLHVETVASGLSEPWAIAFLPDGSALITERPGRLRLLNADGKLSGAISGVPGVDARDQGGLLDVAIDPKFGENRYIYLSFSEIGPNGTNGTAVARGKLTEDRTSIEGLKVIFRQRPKVASTKHYGSRLVFDRQNHLFVTMGERSNREFREQAQSLDSMIGKIARVTDEGNIPADNPFVDREGALPEIYAYGIRNSQAAALHPVTGKLWEIEHGPKGGDELNVIEPGGNYGWPQVSVGVNYDGTPVGTGKASMEGAIDAIYTWTPVIAPSGMLFYGGDGPDAFPEWTGDLFVGGLRSRALVRLELDGEKVTGEERLLEDLGLRIRDVAEGPDGALYVATDHSDGQILRIRPAD